MARRESATVGASFLGNRGNRGAQSLHEPDNFLVAEMLGVPVDPKSSTLKP